MQDIKEIMQ